MATIKVKQIKSRIGAPKDQKRTLDTLGLRKINQVVEVEDTPSTRGMVQKLHHLVIVVDLLITIKLIRNEIKYFKTSLWFG